MLVDDNDQRVGVSGWIGRAVAGEVHSPLPTRHVSGMWATEIERRAERVVAGESRSEPWDRVRGNIERGLGARGLQ